MTRTRFLEEGPALLGLVGLTSFCSLLACAPTDSGGANTGRTTLAVAAGDAVMPPDEPPPPSDLPISPVDEGAAAEGEQLAPPARDDPMMPPETPPWAETEESPVDRLPPPTDPGAMLEPYVAQPEPVVPDAQYERVPAELYEEAAREGAVRVVVTLDVPDATVRELRGLTDARPVVLEIQRRLETDLALMRSGSFTDLRGFRVSPGVTMTVDGEALQYLDRLTYVRQISRQIPLFPTLDLSAEQVNVPGALAVGLSGNGQAVAILDTGVQAAHPFFGGRVVAEACFSLNQCPGATAGPQIGPGTGAPCTTNNRCDHGTHVAGIAAGLNNTMSGVARGANIIAINVFSQSNNPNVCGTNPVPCIVAWTGDIIDGLDQVLLLTNQMNVAAVNLSLGGGPVNTGFCNNQIPAFTTAVNNLRNLGVATAIASGNDGFDNGVSFPACIQNAITVGNVTDNDAVAASSNSGPQVDLMAPGTNINSSVLNGAYANKSGTSMATPHVAGAFAVMRQRFPNDPVATLEQRLENTGVLVTDTAAGMTRPRLRLPFGWVWQSGSGSGWIGLWNQDQTNDKYVIGDFDGDGADDLLSIKDPWVHLHRYTGSGWQFMWGTNSGSIHWWNLSPSDKYVAADFDGDGRDELLAIKDPWAHLMKWNGSSWQYLWGTGGGWIGWWNMDNADRFLAGDLDGDGREELLSIKDPWHHVHRFNGSGWSWLSGSSSGWIGSWNMGSSDKYAVADANGDGRADFLSFKDPWHHTHSYNGGSWQWLSGSGSGWIHLWNMSNSDRYLPIDVDGNGASELMCLNNPWTHLNRYSGGWSWVWGTGSGRFAFWNMNASDRYYAGDFDGDGDEDVLSIKDPWHHVTTWED